MILVLLSLVLGFEALTRYLNTPLQIGPQAMEYTLKPGGSLGTVVYTLAHKKVLMTPYVLMLYSRLMDRGHPIHAGEYVFEPGLTPLSLLDKLEKGEVKTYRLALIEGWKLTQLLSSLKGQEKIDHTLDTEDPRWFAKLGVPLDYPSMEGLFFPDTYQFSAGSSDQSILRQAYFRMQNVLNEEWQAREENLPYQEPYDALIMASLIEKETGVAEERSEIAGVFVRRLYKNMRLQTDPAVIYGLGDNFDGNLRSKHLKDPSNPFNTYRHKGLPPTPIALVGREAIYAALHPSKGDSLYFVAKGDGTHYFSRTFEEHLSAVKKYQLLQRRNDYRSTPKRH